MNHKPGDLVLHYIFKGDDVGYVPEIILIIDSKTREVLRNGNIWFADAPGTWAKLQPIEHFKPLGT